MSHAGRLDRHGEFAARFAVSLIPLLHRRKLPQLQCQSGFHPAARTSSAASKSSRLECSSHSPDNYVQTCGHHGISSATYPLIRGIGVVTHWKPERLASLASPIALGKTR